MLVIFFYSNIFFAQENLLSNVFHYPNPLKTGTYNSNLSIGLANLPEDAVEEACDESGADIDYETASGILTLTFSNGSQIIINRQAALKQIWVAAKQGGFHFDLDESSEQWLCEGKELFAALSEYASEQAGQAITLEAP